MGGSVKHHQKLVLPFCHLSLLRVYEDLDLKTLVDGMMVR